MSAAGQLEPSLPHHAWQVSRGCLQGAQSPEGGGLTRAIPHTHTHSAHRLLPLQVCPMLPELPSRLAPVPHVKAQGIGGDFVMPGEGEWWRSEEEVSYCVAPRLLRVLDAASAPPS